MTTALITIYILSLVLTAIGGFLCCRKIAKVHGGYANIKSLIILNYIAVQAISGIVHLSGSGSRGYYDLLAQGPTTTLIAVVNCVLGMTALCVACMHARVPDRQRQAASHTRWLTGSEIRVILFTLMLITGPALNAMLMLSSYVTEIEATRVISLEGGMARYGFLAHWIVWVISFVALLLVGRKERPWPLATVTVVVVAVFLIAVSLRWTGGRSIVLLMALPLILTMLPRLRGFYWLFVPIMCAGLLLNAATISQARSDALVNGQGVKIVNWLDWEGGRFSLSGFAVDYVNQYGLLYGETFWNGIATVAIAPLKFAGFPVSELGLSSSVQLTGDMLLGDRDITYIVPGLNAELYLNFGLLGVLIGYYLLGRICGFVDILLSRAGEGLEWFALCFVGAVLVLRTISADSGSMYIFIFYMGLPLLACTFVARWLRRRERALTL
jgi:hypothetical protein